MKRLLLSLAVATGLFTASSSSAPDPEVFASPPTPYRPKTWMHSMNGNLSKEGFTKDFEALAKAGVGGALFFHIDRGIPKGPIDFGTDEFNDILAHAAVEADRVGIEFGLHNCDGWSSSGGPWVTPEQSMKKVVAAEKVFSGGSLVLADLPKPDRASDYYEDIAVLAWPASEDAVRLAAATATLAASGNADKMQRLRDGDIDSEFSLAADAAGETWIAVSYDEPVTIRSLITEQRSRHAKGELWVSDDGESYEKVGDLPKLRIGKHHWSFAASYPEGITSRYFRVKLDRADPVRRFELSAYSRIKDWPGQNAMARPRNRPDAEVPVEQSIDRSAVVVLHRGSVEDGSGRLELPEGNWTVARYGFTTTGAQNHPASDAGRGLEIDKLDAAAMDFHFDKYVGLVAKEAQRRGSDALIYSEIDSFEMGGNNWTHGFASKFTDRWGYDFVEWLPTLSGHVIESPDATLAVLTDMRALVADLMVKNYFKRFTELCNEHGMKSYVEPYGLGTLNELEAGGVADKTMGEFWIVDKGFKGIFRAAVSASRVYGKKVISAESFTAWQKVNWRGHPYSMKIFGDHAWASGINETMFHRFAHQPNTHVVPGMTMGNVGSHIDRTQTWWDNAGSAWFDYLARGSYLLQQGVPASDVLAFGGDERPNSLVPASRFQLPRGTRADDVNTDVLMNRITVRDGELVLPEGTRYKVLYLNDPDRLRFSTLKRIAELIRKGATVVGTPPVKPIGYLEQKEKSKAFSKLVAKVWGEGEEPVRYGKGLLFPSGKTREAFDYLGLKPDLIINGEGAKHFTHRTIGSGELYFFFNETKEFQTMNCDFRVSGMKPEIWHADSGRIEKVDTFLESDGRTQLTLTVEPHGSRFVYFRPSEASAPETEPATLALLELIGATGNAVETEELELPWQVAFDEAWGGPGVVEMDTLQDWTQHEAEGVRHYSGTATYRSRFSLPSGWDPAKQAIALDLGEVKIAARVAVNGESFPVLWKPPFALDVTAALKPGENRIEIEVTNVWTNRLIGDEAFPRNDGYDMKQPIPAWYSNNEPPPESPRYTFTTHNFYSKDKTLEPSGLHGPVRLIRTAGNASPASSDAQTRQAESHRLPAADGLMCELLGGPEVSGIRAARPRLSWKIGRKVTGAQQTAYRIQVADAGHFALRTGKVIWDSGKVASSQSVAVPYGGEEPLSPSQALAWRVKFWDSANGESFWSEPQLFRTAETLTETASTHQLTTTIVEPVSMKQLEPGRLLIDFGKVGFGFMELQLKGSAESEGSIVLGERGSEEGVFEELSEKTSVRLYEVPFAIEPRRVEYAIHPPRDMRNTKEVAIPIPGRFGTIGPFRYVEIRTDPSIELQDIVAKQVVVHYPWDEYASRFTSSNSLLNDIWDLCKYSMKATSFAGIYVDGDRERIPYEADAYINQLSHYAVEREYSIARYSHEYLLENPTWPTEWKQHSVMMAYQDWLYTGDLESVRRNFQLLREEKTLEQMAREDGLLKTFGGERVKGRKERDIVDWPRKERDNFDFKLVNTVVNSFYYLNLGQMAEMAEALGEDQVAEAYRSKQTAHYARFNEVLFDEGTGLYVDGEGSTHSSIHANLMPLAVGLVPADRVEKVAQYVIGKGMACSVYMAQYLLEGLYHADEYQAALDLMTSTGKRSWSNMLEVGSTITLEAWDDIYKPNQDWNHAWGAVPGNIVARYLLGVRPLKPGFEEILVAPRPADLQSADGVVPTIRGAVWVAFDQSETGVFKLTLQLPGNSSTRVSLPIPEGKTAYELTVNGETMALDKAQGSHDLENVQPGKHTFELKYK